MSEKSTPDLNAMAAKAQEAADLKAAMAAKEAAGKPQAAKDAEDAAAAAAKKSDDNQDPEKIDYAKAAADKLALASDASKGFGIENRKVRAVYADLVDPTNNHRYTTQPQTILDKNGWVAFQLLHGKMEYVD